MSGCLFCTEYCSDDLFRFKVEVNTQKLFVCCFNAGNMHEEVLLQRPQDTFSSVGFYSEGCRIDPHNSSNITVLMKCP